MSLYTDIRDAVFTFTGRPDLTAETDVAIVQALRSAHKAGTFWRDLITVSLTNQPVDQIQSIDLTAAAPSFGQVATVKPTDSDLFYTPADIRDLLDPDKYARLDVYWIVGTTLNIRAANPASAITLVYYKRPAVSPIASIDSWIAELYPDVISLSAAATVLATVGEQEVKTRIETLQKRAVADLISENTEAVRR